MSQSNATSATDSGRTTLDELRAWLRAEIEQRMHSDIVWAHFTGNVWCCRRTT